ncbi:MAG TPA: DUF2461 family protein [Candidatus Acidoferrales bacterium]|nr:DUF2461 family protein [Candidatus Acidoferrales bacterium]
MRRNEKPSGTKQAAFPADTFRFFRELGRNNRKPWMDVQRERYRAVVVAPLRALLDRLTPAVIRLDPNLDASGRTNRNFSRINRDIRFAADKTPYRTHMYLKFPDRSAPSSDSCELYFGVSAEVVTAGFRAYHSGRQSRLSQVARPRAAQQGRWLQRQRRRLGGDYESYWYASERGEWTRHDGWPVDPAEWKKLKGWVVRRKLKPAAATRPGIAQEIERVFRDVYPLYRFVSSVKWNA